MAHPDTGQTLHRYTERRKPRTHRQRGEPTVIKLRYEDTDTGLVVETTDERYADVATCQDCGQEVAIVGDRRVALTMVDLIRRTGRNTARFYALLAYLSVENGLQPGAREPATPRFFGAARDVVHHVESPGDPSRASITLIRKCR